MNNFNTQIVNSQELPVPSPSQEILQLPISDIIADFETHAYRLEREPVDKQTNFKGRQKCGKY